MCACVQERLCGRQYRCSVSCSLVECTRRCGVVTSRNVLGRRPLIRGPVWHMRRSSAMPRKKHAILASRAVVQLPGVAPVGPEGPVLCRRVLVGIDSSALDPACLPAQRSAVCPGASRARQRDAIKSLCLMMPLPRWRALEQRRCSGCSQCVHAEQCQLCSF